MCDGEGHFVLRETQMVHAMLRREFAPAPAAIRAVGSGSDDRASVVARLDLITAIRRSATRRHTSSLSTQAGSTARLPPPSDEGL
ncbi:hypothetical protein MSAS_17030 [Mycobacterium saskatchewanense]|uniref:Uncharacterized protein n=1 Tax=Mycobacterium saskatchewanense TaxID=220927 RepID=A0AAJ3NSV7_9MYCO|nr:hypothetical protein AWC23_08780 [Mycobacterium saskatchewanense]BBX62529.1 hypothetical protein MSAS_17030 [Mycobacterium saskatchewanense]